MKRKMPFRSLWKRALASEMGRAGAGELMNRIEDRYRRLSDDHRDESHPVLKRHLYDNILPQVAAYQVFLEMDNNGEAAFNRIEKLHFLTLRVLKAKYKFLSRFPICFDVMRFAMPRSLKRNHPPQGWDIEWVENNKKCLYTKVHSCFYYQVIKDYGIPELALIYCNGDDHVFDIESRHIKWGRTATVTRGGDYCDVIYHRLTRRDRGREKKAAT